MTAESHTLTRTHARSSTLYHTPASRDLFPPPTNNGVGGISLGIPFSPRLALGKLKLRAAVGLAAASAASGIANPTASVRVDCQAPAPPAVSGVPNTKRRRPLGKIAAASFYKGTKAKAEAGGKHSDAAWQKKLAAIYKVPAPFV